MKEFVSSLINVVDKMCQQKVVTREDFSREQLEQLEGFINSFNFILSYPIDKRINSIEVINDLFYEGKMLSRTFYIESQAFEDRLKKDVNLHHFMISGDEYQLDSSKQDKRYPLLYSIGYEKDGYFVKQYITLKTNNSIYQKYSKGYQDFTKGKTTLIQVEFEIPSEFEGKAEDLFGEYIIKNDGDTYHISCLAFLEYSNIGIAASKVRVSGSPLEKIGLVKIALGQDVEGFRYVQYGDRLILKECYDRLSAYEDMLNMAKEQDKGIAFIDKDGHSIERSNIITAKTLYGIRNCYTHSKGVYRYIINNPLARVDTFEGGVFVLQDMALIYSYRLNMIMGNLSRLSKDVKDAPCSYVYCPKIKSRIKAGSDGTIYSAILDYLDSCRTVTIFTPTSFKRDVLREVVNILLSKYKKKYNNSDMLYDYMVDNVKKIIPDASITISRLECTDVLASRLANNKYFVQWDSVHYQNSQEYCIEQILPDIYNFSITSGKVVLKNGKFDAVGMDADGVSSCLDYIYKNIKFLLKNTTGASMDGTFGPFADEAWVALCIFLGYICIVLNGFDEDIDEHKSKLTPDKRDKITAKLHKDMFKGFTIFNAHKSGSDRNYSVDDTKHMKHIVSIIRNNISHFGVKVKHNKSGNPKEHYLIFTDYENKNLTYRIMVKDFIEFITHPLFVEYKSVLIPTIAVDSWDELVGTVSALIKKED